MKIHTHDNLITYWQNKDRTNSQLFKAAYQAIVDNPLDPTIVVTTISLMPHGDSACPHLNELLELSLEHHFSYRRPITNYPGGSGDTIARIVRKLARSYIGQGEYERSIAFIERLLIKRKSEVNDQMLELLSIVHVEALHLSGQTAAVNVLN